MDMPEGLQEFIAPVIAPPTQATSEQPSIAAPEATVQQQEVSPLPEGLQEFIAPVVKEQQAEEKYGSLGQQAIAGVEGLAEGVAGPLVPVAEQALNQALFNQSPEVTNENIRSRKEQNPVTSTLGNVVGFAGSLATGLGEAALVEKAGEAAVKAAGMAPGVTAAALKTATEMALLQSGDEVTKLIVQDPNASVQTAVTDIGLASLLGGGIGGTLKAAAPLWNTMSGGKVGQIIEDFKGTIQHNLENPEPVEAMTKELNGLFSSINQEVSDTFGVNGIKKQAIDTLIPEMNDKILEQASRIKETLNDGIDKLMSKNDPNAGILAEHVAKFDERLMTESPSEIFEAIQDLKKALQEDAQYNKNLHPLSERLYRNTVKELAYDLRTSLEDPEVWGKAADIQKTINAAASKYFQATKDFRKLMISDVMGQPGINPGKINTYLNQLGKPNAEIKQTIVKNYIEHTQAFKDALGKAYAAVGLESPIQPTSLNFTMHTLKEPTTGSKLANIFIKRGLSDAGSKALAAGVGGTLGHELGHGGFGALIGLHALAPFFNSVLPALAKPMLSAANSATGLKQAIEYGVAVSRGEKLLESASKNLFKEGVPVIRESLIPTEKDRAKLDKAVQEAYKNPSKLINMNDKVGHYLPDHGTSVAATAGTAAQVLNSLRPSTDPKLPLDNKQVLSTTQKAAYNNALNIAQQPLMVLDKIKQGTVTAQDVKLIQQIYPDLYKRMTAKLSKDLALSMAAGVNIPYKTRLGLSMFMAQPLDTTMVPSSIVNAQLASQSTSKQAQMQGPKQQGERTKHSLTSLNKLPSAYMTPGQNKAARHQK